MVEIRRSLRAFQRVKLHDHADNMRTIIGATVEISTLSGQLAVYDISYKGAAFECPEGNWSVNDTLQLILDLSGPRVEVECRVVRLKEPIIAVQFLSMSASGHKALEVFLRDKLSGSQMVLVNREFMNGFEEVDYWFQGPGGNNVFLWQRGDDLLRGIVELFDLMIFYEDGLFIQRAKSAADEMAVGREEIATLENIKRALGLLSQVEDPDEILKPLINLLLSES